MKFPGRCSCNFTRTAATASTSDRNTAPGGCCRSFEDPLLSPHLTALDRVRRVLARRGLKALWAESTESRTPHSPASLLPKSGRGGAEGSDTGLQKHTNGEKPNRGRNSVQQETRFPQKTKGIGAVLRSRRPRTRLSRAAELAGIATKESVVVSRIAPLPRPLLVRGDAAEIFHVPLSEK